MMRRRGLYVVLLGLTTLGYIAIDALSMPVSAPVDQAAGRVLTVTVQGLIAWAAFVVVICMVIAAGSIRVLLTSGPRTKPRPSPEVRDLLREGDVDVGPAENRQVC